MRARGFQASSQIKEVYEQYVCRRTCPSKCGGAVRERSRADCCCSRFQGAVAQLNSKYGRNGFQTTAGETLGQPGKWVWMNTQTVFVRSATLGAVFGVSLAFAVLLVATRNVVVALSATVTIAGILASVRCLWHDQIAPCSPRTLHRWSTGVSPHHNDGVEARHDRERFVDHPCWFLCGLLRTWLSWCAAWHTQTRTQR